MSRPQSHTVPMRKAELEAEAEALELKLTGAPYRRIAELQGCSVSTAHDRVDRALAHIVPTEGVEALRKVEGERLEEATARVLRIMLHPDASADTVLDAASKLVRISERRSKLYGLDVPVAQHLTLTVTDEQERRLQELVEELAAMPAGPVEP